MILLITSATATRDRLPPRHTDDSHTRFRGRRVSLRIGFNAGVLFKEFLSTRPRKNIQRRCEVTIQKNKQSVFFFSSLPSIGREVISLLPRCKRKLSGINPVVQGTVGCVLVFAGAQGLLSDPVAAQSVWIHMFVMPRLSLVHLLLLSTLFSL